MNTIKSIVVLTLCIASVMAVQSGEIRDKRLILSPYSGIMGSTSMMYPSMMAPSMMAAPLVMTRSIMSPMMPAMATLPAMTAIPAGMPALTMPLTAPMPAPLIR